MLPLSNNTLTLVDRVPFLLVAIVVAVCSKTFGFECVFSKVVVAVVVPVVSITSTLRFPK